MADSAHTEPDNPSPEKTQEEVKRVRAAEKVDKAYKFQHKVRYKKPSNFRRKLKKRYHKYKTAFIVSFIVISVVLFFVIIFQSAWETTKEIEKRNIELKKQKQIDAFEKNKKI